MNPTSRVRPPTVPTAPTDQLAPTSTAKPIAKVVFEPTGPRSKSPRDYSLKIEIALSTLAPKHADREHVAALIRRSMLGLASAPAEVEPCSIEELVTRGKTHKDGTVPRIVVGVEGAQTISGRPGEECVQRLRASLTEDGYRVAIQERRGCAEPSCTTDALTDWGRQSDVPPTWYSDLICGRHDYKSCVGCQSVYVMDSVSSAGPAPSLHCEVCGTVIVEWGGSKAWEARLVQRGPRAMERLD